MTAIRDYYDKNRWLRERYPEVSAVELYSSIFPLEMIEKKGDLSHRFSNPVFSFRQVRVTEDGERKAFFHNEIIYADHFEESLKKAEKNDVALCSALSYFGRNKDAEHAYKCHGFIIDLDCVGQKELENFFGWVYDLERIPVPTYMINSGAGVHVYYIFENPVPLYPNVVDHLQILKRALTDWIWNKETSKDRNRQHQGIYQCFRMPGSRCKLGRNKPEKTKDRYLVRAFKTGPPVTINYLNRFVEEEFRCPENPDYSSWEWADGEHLSLTECELRYPEWYQKRIIEKKPPGQWTCNRALYNWWYNTIQIPGNAKDGNRYHCISMLYVYGKKCALPKSMIDADAMNLLDIYNSLTVHEGNEFTEKDIKAASKFYNIKFVKFTKEEISRRTGIPIRTTTKRNGRRQDLHLKLARASRDILCAERGKSDWREGNRRPKGSGTAQKKVEEWRKNHPDGKKADCIRDTGLSKPTVYKWW